MPYWMLTQCWQIMLLFLVALAATPFLKNASPRVRHAVWLCVLLRFLLVPIEWLPERQGVGPDEPTAGRVVAWVTTPLPVVALVGGERAAAADAPIPVEGAGAWFGALASEAWWVLALMYSLGASFLLARVVRDVRLLHRAIGASAPAPLALSRRVETLRRRIGVRRRVRVTAIVGLPSPVTIGLVRPRILVPADLPAVLDGDELDHVLVHELIHIRRHDVAVHWLATFVRVVYWFHPAAWLVASRVEHERELVADELAMKEGGSQPMAYGETLIKVAARDADMAAALPAPAMSGRGPSLETRILGIKRARRVGGGRWAIALSGLALAASVSATTTQEIEEVIEIRAASKTPMHAWVETLGKKNRIAPPVVEHRGVRLVAGPTSKVIVLGAVAPLVLDAPKGGTRRRPFRAARTNGLLTLVGVRRASDNGGKEASVYRVRGEELSSARSLRSELRSELPGAMCVGPAALGGTVRLRHVASVVAAGWSAGVRDFSYRATPMSTREVAKLKKAFASLRGKDHDVLLVMDGKTTWQRVAKTVAGLAHVNIARISFVVSDRNGTLTKLPMYLRRDASLEQEEEEEILEEEPEPEELVEELEEPEEEIEIEEVPPKERPKKKVGTPVRL